MGRKNLGGVRRTASTKGEFHRTNAKFTSARGVLRKREPFRTGLGSSLNCPDLLGGNYSLSIRRQHVSEGRWHACIEERRSFSLVGFGELGQKRGGEVPVIHAATSWKIRVYDPSTCCTHALPLLVAPKSVIYVLRGRRLDAVRFDSSC